MKKKMPPPMLAERAIYMACILTLLCVSIYYRSAGRTRAEQQKVSAIPSMESGRAGSIKKIASKDEFTKSILDQIPIDKAFPKEKTEMADVAALLDSDPEFEAAMLTELSGVVDKHYYDFIKSSKLNTNQANKLRLALAERQLEIFRQFSKDRAKGTQASIKGFYAARDVVNDEIADVLGPAGMEELSEYEATMSIRNNIDQYSRRLDYLGLSLTSDQKEAVIERLAQVNPREYAARQRNYLQPNRIEPLKTRDLEYIKSIISKEQYEVILEETSIKEEKRSIESRYRNVFQNAFRAMR